MAPLPMLAGLVYLYGLNAQYVAKLVLAAEKERLKENFFKVLKKWQSRKRPA